MRYVALLVCSCVVFAQSPGKPGVTDPIKDPRQIPGHANPGPVPQSTPQPGAPPTKVAGPVRRRRKTKKSKAADGQTPRSGQPAK